MTSVIPMPYRLLATLLAAGGLFATGAWLGWSERGDREGWKQAKADAKAHEVAKATEEAWRNAIYATAYDLELKRITREKETDRTVACLRDGTCRVRDRFTCPRLPAASGATVPTDDPEEGGLRPEDAAVLTGFADECDAVTEERNAGKAYAETVTRKLKQ